MITGLLVEPGKLPKKISIENKLEELQKLVEGYIEFIYINSDNVCLIVNEEGRIKNLPFNRYYKGEILVGNILVFGIKDDDLISLTEKQLTQYKLFFGTKSFI